MTNTGHTEQADSNRDATDQHRSVRPERLTATVVERDCEPDECTIYPADASGETLVTTWVTAKEGSYVALEEMR